MVKKIVFLIDCQRATRGQKWALPFLFITATNLHSLLFGRPKDLQAIKTTVEKAGGSTY